jgi:hypothetical protein
MRAQSRRPIDLRGILEATRDFACTFYRVWQTPLSFALSDKKPRIALIGDDAAVALGPNVLSSGERQALLADSAFVAIVACEAIPRAYNMAATFAARDRENTVVIETQPEWKDAWLELVREARPDAGILLCMPEEVLQFSFFHAPDGTTSAV